MKKFLSKLSLLKIVTAIVVIALIVFFVSKLPQLAMKSSSIEEVSNEAVPPAGEVIAKDAPKTLVAESNGKQLYVDPATLNVEVVDTQTGMVWSSLPKSSEDGPELTEDEKAPLFISFLDATGAISEWDAYTYCIANDNTTRELEEGESLTDTYTINKIDNGFRATLKVSEIESTVLNEYMPQQISIDRYNECFIEKIDELLAAGTITDEQAERYNKALSMIYAIDDKTHDYYYNKYAGTPPVTVTTILIDLAKKVNYTTEDLMNDSREFNIVVEIAHPADFSIVMDVTLDAGDLVVSVPTYEIQNNSEDKEYYTLQNITIFPNFGLIDATRYTEGFIFVPDGSGALFDINSYDSGYTAYSRPVYNNTYYDTLYQESEYKEDLMMPVFGMGKVGAEYFEEPTEEPTEAESAAEGEDAAEESAGEPAEEEPAAEDSAEEEQPSEEASDVEGAEETPTEAPKDYNGFLAIIEGGAETASINVELGTPDTSGGGTNFNKVYPSFDVMQYSNVKVFGPYSSSDAKFLATTDQFDVNLKVRYKLYTEDCNYYTMASDYRNYIISTQNLTPSFDEKPEIFLDVISSLTVKDRIMGVPYDHTFSMTTYSELESILDDLQGVDAVVSYKGAYNGGIYNKINLKADKTKSNGSEKDYQSLMAKYGSEIYMSTPISRVYKDSAVFEPDNHALSGYDSEPAHIYDYDIPTGRFNHNGEGYWMVAPKYLKHVVDGFTSSVGDVNLAIEDLGNQVYANYKASAPVSLYEGERVVDSALSTLTADRSLILYNPIASRMLYADYAADISRESSDYGLIHHNVPFRQLVMNGLVKYTTLDVNESSSGKNYYVLQALELGSMPKFKITSKNVDILKENNYNKLYSTCYDIVKDEIKSVNTEVTDAFAKIGTTEIMGHEILDDKIFVTTYATGVKVVTNYNTFEADTPYGTLGAMGYTIVEGGEINE